MKDYYGWRARIGLIYMASSTVMEPEFYAMAPEGVSIHTDRIILPAPTIEGLVSPRVLSLDHPARIFGRQRADAIELG